MLPHAMLASVLLVLVACAGKIKVAGDNEDVKLLPPDSKALFHTGECCCRQVTVYRAVLLFG